MSGTLTAEPLISASGMQGTGGDNCTEGVDFQKLNAVPYTIAAGATSAEVNVVICGDTTEEPDEQLWLTLSFPGCFEPCTAIGIIRNDDGFPKVTVGDAEVTESGFGGRKISFPLALSHPYPSNVTVHFATRDGTARGGTGCFGRNLPDYVSKSGTVGFPANSTAKRLEVTVCSDGKTEAQERLYIDISNPQPRYVVIDRGTAEGRIRGSD